MFSTRLMQNFLLGFLGLVLVLGVWWMGLSGVRAGKSNAIIKNASMLKQGVQYFFNDQNRYPTALEFQDRNLMLNYFSAFPPQAITGGPCSQTYNYTSATAKTFVLEFCLPRAAAGFAAGWNKVTQ